MASGDYVPDPHDNGLRPWPEVARLYREMNQEHVTPARCRHLHLGAVKKLREGLGGLDPRLFKDVIGMMRRYAP